MRNVWRLKTHDTDPDAALRWMRQNERIALGWGAIGDIAAQSYTDAAQISAAIEAAYPANSNAAQGGLNLWSFFSEMKPKDLVILSASTPRTLVVEVTGEYLWTPEKPALDQDELGDYQHQRRARLSAYSPEALWRAAGGRHAPGQNPRWTLFRCTQPVA